MPDGNGMLSDMEFENELREMGENQLELTKFIARQQFTTSKILVSHDKRIKVVEKQNKKMMGFIGSGGAMLGTAITILIDYFRRS